MSHSKKISTLVLVRHGQSQWNKENLFTGWKDPDLTEKGIEEAINAGKKIKQTNIIFDLHFTSKLKRAQRTGNLIMKELEEDIATTENEALNERDYGDLSGLNKDDARKKWGDEQVHVWRRSYDTPPPGGESLQNTAERVLPYFENIIYPELRNQKNILISAHGNSLRALIMYLEKISEDEIVKLEIATGQPIVYKLDEDLQVISKEIL
jgi:2,3-bisphosphoglycerate-dependent phosphoglycerate mutase